MNTLTWLPPMPTFTAHEAGNRFSELIDRAQCEPVRVTRDNHVVGVMVSAEDYAAMRSFYAGRLRSTFKHSAQMAAANGLTATTLEQLLADED